MADTDLLGRSGEAAASPGPELNTLIEAYAAARQQREAASARLKQFQEIEDRVTRDLFDAMERINVRSVKHDTLGTFALNDLAWAKIEDADLARVWAETEFPEAITINLQRLAVIVREALRGDRQMPPGVSYSTSRKISWRGGPKGASQDGE